MQLIQVNRLILQLNKDTKHVVKNLKSQKHRVLEKIDALTLSMQNDHGQPSTDQRSKDDLEELKKMNEDELKELHRLNHDIDERLVFSFTNFVIQLPS